MERDAKQIVEVDADRIQLREIGKAVKRLAGLIPGKRGFSASGLARRFATCFLF